MKPALMVTAFLFMPSFGAAIIFNPSLLIFPAMLIIVAGTLVGLLKVEEMHTPHNGDIGEEERRRHIEIPEEAPVEIPEPEKVPA